jgi:hypothetical protein
MPAGPKVNLNGFANLGNCRATGIHWPARPDALIDDEFSDRSPTFTVTQRKRSARYGSDQAEPKAQHRSNVIHPLIVWQFDSAKAPKRLELLQKQLTRSADAVERGCRAGSH